MFLRAFLIFACFFAFFAFALLCFYAFSAFWCFLCLLCLVFFLCFSCFLVRVKSFRKKKTKKTVLITSSLLLLLSNRNRFSLKEIQLYFFGTLKFSADLIFFLYLKALFEHCKIQTSGPNLMLYADGNTWETHIAYQCFTCY